MGYILRKEILPCVKHNFLHVKINKFYIVKKTDNYFCNLASVINKINKLDKQINKLMNTHVYIYVNHVR